jgi:hypothetical protein
MTARLAGALALAAIVVLHLFAIVRLANRYGLEDGDEAEYLHAGLLMARGERVFVDFAEHHSPLLFQVLARLDGGDVDAYVRRARIFSSLCGLAAVAAAAFLVWRATRQLYAPAILIGGLSAAPLFLSRNFADVRPDTLALALFLLGVLLIATSRRIAAGALGVGLIALAFFVNPKWPLSSLALGLVFMIGPSPARRAAAAAGAVACAFLLLAVSTDLRAYVDFVFLFNRHFFHWSAHIAKTIIPMPPFRYCPDLLRPHLVLPAAALVAFAVARFRDAFADARIVWGSLLLLVTSLLEIRFVYPYPVLWPQYFVVWGLAGAAVFAFVPRAVVALVPERVRPAAGAVAVVFVLIAGVRIVIGLPLPGRAPAAISMARLAAILQPGDTVFLGAVRHPLDARDASYYWFGFGDVVPAALDFAKTPRGKAILPPIGEEDLPPCRLERGLEPHLRLVGSDPFRWLPVVDACVQRLRARGILVPTHAIGVFRVRRPGESE